MILLKNKLTDIFSGIKDSLIIKDELIVKKKFKAINKNTANLEATWIWMVRIILPHFTTGRLHRYYIVNFTGFISKFLTEH